MSVALTERQLEFTVAHLCAGIGFGALGFSRGHARVGRVSARFRTLFGLDVDPVACADFERIVGAPCHRIDLFDAAQYTAFHGHTPPEGWQEATPDTLRACSAAAPDVLFWSPPCKGLSSLLNALAAGSARYQALNELVLRVLDLALEAWADSLPSLFLLENVPRIQTRGRALLDSVKLRLDLAGYACAETVHDCGELGGLAHVMFGPNPGGVSHCVVGRMGTVVWDPNPSRAGLAAVDGLIFLVPLDRCPPDLPLAACWHLEVSP